MNQRAGREMERGVTMAELMISLVVMGAVAAVTLPSLSQTFREDALKKEARIVTDLFHEYRAEARSSGRSMFLLLYGWPGSSYYWHMVSPGTNSSCTFPWATWWQDKLYYEWGDAGKGVASIVPVDSMTNTTGYAYVCIRPNGRLYTIDWSGTGFFRPYTGKIRVYVDDIKRPYQSNYVVSVGMNASAKIYRP